MSLGIFWKGFSNSLATSCNPVKHMTVNIFKIKPNTSLVRNVSIKIGISPTITSTKSVVICAWGNGNGMYAIFRA